MASALASIKKMLVVLNTMDKHINYSLIVYYRYSKKNYAMMPRYRVTKWDTRKKKQPDGKFKTINTKLFEESYTTNDLIDYLVKEMNGDNYEEEEFDEED